MRIATITFHCSYNYGSVLQAYALQQYLLQQGYDTKIIDYRSADFNKYRIIPKSINKKALMHTAREFLYLKHYLYRRRSFQQFWKKHLILTEKTYWDYKQLEELNDQFDVFICGSDQIWNLDCTKGVDPAYFLAFAADDRRKVAYAPSLAKSMFKQDCSIELENALKSFDYISVREKSTIPAIQKYTSVPVSSTLDPTLLLGAKEYPQQKPKGIKEDEHYIFLYMLGLDEKLISYCEELSVKKNLPFFYITGNETPYKRKKLNKGRNLFGVKPEEFLYIISHAQYVVTSSFHAVVFSILFEKSFGVVHRNNTSARTLDLLESLHLENRVIKDGFDIDKKIDYKDIGISLSSMVQSSRDFLEEALSGLT